MTHQLLATLASVLSFLIQAAGAGVLVCIGFLIGDIYRLSHPGKVGYRFGPFKGAVVSVVTRRDQARAIHPATRTQQPARTTPVTPPTPPANGPANRTAAANGAPAPRQRGVAKKTMPATRVRQDTFGDIEARRRQLEEAAEVPDNTPTRPVAPAALDDEDED